MKFDTVIIGGGLSGLLCGIRLQKAGKKCAIVSAGQSAIHFSSGSFDLLGRLPDGTAVENPLEALSGLNPDHPYSLLGKEKVCRYAEQAPLFLESCGVMSAARRPGTAGASHRQERESRHGSPCQTLRHWNRKSRKSERRHL